jgi:hypothetical protein
MSSLSCGRRGLLRKLGTDLLIIELDQIRSSGGRPRDGLAPPRAAPCPGSLRSGIDGLPTADLARHGPIIRGGACTTDAVREAHSPSFRLSLSLTSFHFEGRLPWVDGRFPWVARRRTTTLCPRDRALSSSRSAILLGGSVLQPKLRESRKHLACLLQTTACPFAKMSVAVSLQSALCSNALLAATLPRRLGSRPGCWWALREPDQYRFPSDRCCASSALDLWR